MREPELTISAVEREVGLSKDVLRVWERRYGFPNPGRDGNGERTYPSDQVRRLGQVKRLMDRGHRPGRLLSMSTQELEALLGSRAGAGADDSRAAPRPELGELLDRVRAHDVQGFERALQQRLAREGLAKFVQDTVAPLVAQVGEEWAQGLLMVFEEHLFTELTARVLRQAIAAVPGGAAPRVLLTTPPDESHAMGLLMLEAMLALHGARCISLGPQMPLLDIARAAQAHHVDVVALSFSAAFPVRQASAVLQQLRAALPAAVQLWAGGAGVARASVPEGVLRMAGFSDAVAALQAGRPG